MNVLQWFDRLAGDSEDLHQLDTADRWFDAWLVACEMILIQIPREDRPAARMFETAYGLEPMKDRILNAVLVHDLIDKTLATYKALDWPIR